MEFPDCKFFHYDAYRGREVMRCRLLERSGNHSGWTLKLCQSCPVPDLLDESECDELLLEGEIVRRWGLFPRVKVFAACGTSLEPLTDPRRCVTCREKKAS